jgi:hypothetical protein
MTRSYDSLRERPSATPLRRCRRCEGCVSLWPKQISASRSLWMIFSGVYFSEAFHCSFGCKNRPRTNIRSGPLSWAQTNSMSSIVTDDHSRLSLDNVTKPMRELATCIKYALDIKIVKIKNNVKAVVRKEIYSVRFSHIAPCIPSMTT